MKKLILILTLPCLLILGGCGSSMKVSYDYDREVDFSTAIKPSSCLPWAEKAKDLVRTQWSDSHQ